jgi:hypothetical protein
MTSAVTTTNTTAGQDPDHGSAVVEPLTQTALVTAQGQDLDRRHCGGKDRRHGDP